MPETGKEGAPAVVILIPGHGMLPRVLATFVASRVDSHQHLDIGADVIEVIPFVVVGEGLRHVRRRDVVAIRHVELRRLRGRMVLEIGTHESAVPTPMVLCSGRTVYAHKSAAGLDIPLEGGLLHVIQYVTARIKKDNGGILRQAVLVKPGRIGRGVHHEPVIFANFNQRLLARIDRRMHKAFSLAENEDFRWSATLFATACQLEKYKYPYKKHGSDQPSWPS